MISEVQDPVPVTPAKGLSVRLVHAGLALAVIVQLGTSLAMETPDPGQPESLLFEAHQIAGLVALALAVAFWAVALVRRAGAGAAPLLPWFDASARRAVRDDLARHVAAARALRLAEHVEGAPLASAIHGLGLSLMTAMAGLGAFWLLGETLGAPATILEAAIGVHALLGNVVWAYLFGHAGMALAHEAAGARVLGTMRPF